MPGEFWVDNKNKIIDPNVKALGISNWVTTEGLPEESNFSDTCDDPENFRIALTAMDTTALIVYARLEVVRDGDVILTNNYWLEKHDGRRFRSRFLRLVTDEADDAASGHARNEDPNQQTILVKLGDSLRVSYEPFTGQRVYSEIKVGRPSSEDDNGPDPKKHDIRELKLNIVVFRKFATSGDPESCITRASVERDIERCKQRLAQANIKVTVVNLNMGPKIPNPGIIENGVPLSGYHDGGIELPEGSGINWSNGFDGAGGFNPSLFTAEEIAIFSGFKDSDPNTIDVFYFEKESLAVEPYVGDRGWSYFVSRNNPEPFEDNNIAIMAARTELTLAHEILHVLLNSGNHDEGYRNSLFDVTSESIWPDIFTESATKRIGPWLNCKDPEQTKKIRDTAESLPQRQ